MPDRFAAARRTRPAASPTTRLFGLGMRLGLGLCLLAALAACDSAQRATSTPPTPAADATRGPVDFASLAPGSQFEAMVGRIHDGDSFDLKDDRGRRIGVRISGIDAPERRQPYADVSRRHLQALIGGQPVRIHVLGHDRYGRILGQVEGRPAPGGAAGANGAAGALGASGAASTAETGRAARPGRAGQPGQQDRPGKAGVDVGLAQIEAGLAWYFRRYERDLPPTWRSRYDAAEDLARGERRGLWREPEPIPPWRYREDRRQAGAAAGSRSNN